VILLKNDCSKNSGHEGVWVREESVEGLVVVVVVAAGPLTLIPNASPYHSERRTRSVVLLVVVLGPARGDPDVDVKRSVLGAVSVVVFCCEPGK